jgi:dienelactone hydrolase
MKSFILMAGLLVSSALPSQDGPTSRPAYDPLVLSVNAKVQRVDLVAKRGARDIPILIYSPAGSHVPLPVLVFSHGLGGSRMGCSFLGDHWAARGYAVAFVQHAGSDEGVWMDLPKWRRFGALKEAASSENLKLRTQDIVSVLDALTEWNGDEGHPLFERLDLEHVGMSGHSFGALTTQMVSGQKSGLFGGKWGEGRIDASIALSPSPPQVGSLASAFAEVFVPMLLMTGTNDVSPIGSNNMETRTKVFPALPETIDRYELVLDGAEHSAFTDTVLFGENSDPHPNHHRVILALSTAFWDAYLLEDKAAQEWLVGAAPRRLMEAADAWQYARAK